MKQPPRQPDRKPGRRSTPAPQAPKGTGEGSRTALARLIEQEDSRKRSRPPADEPEGPDEPTS